MRRTRRSSLPRRWSFLFFPIDVDGTILSPLPNDCQEECPRGSLHPVEHLKHCAADAVYRGEILSDLSNAISSCFTHWAIAHGAGSEDTAIEDNWPQSRYRAPIANRWLRPRT